LKIPQCNRMLGHPAIVRTTSSLRRRPSVRPRLPICCQLAPAADPVAMPSDSTSNPHRLPDSSASFPGDLPTFVVDRPMSPAFQPGFDLRRCLTSGSAFVSACDRRRLPILQPCLPTNFRLAPSVDLPAQPFSRPPACAFGQPSGSACEPDLRLSSVSHCSAPHFGGQLGLRRRPAFLPCLQNDLRLIVL
jgi:hypothetical protein